LNIGAAARAMSNFGFMDLRLVAPYAEAWKEARSAVGAREVLEHAQVFTTVGNAIAGAAMVIGTGSLGHRELQLDVMRLEESAPRIRGFAGRTALLFGSEKFGLSNQDLSYCDWLLRIPTREEHESMNLGQAVALCLYEIARDASAVTARRGPRGMAEAGAVARIEETLMEILRESGYVNEVTAGSTTLKTRRMLRRMNLSARDATVWLGMLRQIHWKQRQR
jgi:tRNA/rRNA methyltransferase